MTGNKGREYCLVVEGAYLTESEAEHALRDPLRGLGEQNGTQNHNRTIYRGRRGHFGSLGRNVCSMIASWNCSVDPDRPLTSTRPRALPSIERQDMFEEVNVEPRDGSNLNGIGSHMEEINKTFVGIATGGGRLLFGLLIIFAYVSFL